MKNRPPMSILLALLRDGENRTEEIVWDFLLRFNAALMTCALFSIQQEKNQKF